MPLPRPAKAPVTVAHLLPRDLTGDWVLTWGGSEWRVSLSTYGDYIATSKGGSTWTGSWFMDGSGSLYISEALLDENGMRGGESRWSVIWERGKHGRFDTRSLSGAVVRPDGTVSVTIALRRPPRK